MFMTLALNLTSAKIASLGWFDTKGFVGAFADWTEETSEFG
jgi:hypothetical protein